MNVKEFWKVILAQDENAIRKYFHKDAYINWHCTNEHFNVDEFIIANCEYPGDWDGVVERIERMNDLTITVTSVYPKDRSTFFRGKHDHESADTKKDVHTESSEVQKTDMLKYHKKSSQTA